MKSNNKILNLVDFQLDIKKVSRDFAPASMGIVLEDCKPLFSECNLRFDNFKNVGSMEAAKARLNRRFNYMSVSQLSSDRRTVGAIDNLSNFVVIEFHFHEIFPVTKVVILEVFGVRDL